MRASNSTKQGAICETGVSETGETGVSETGETGVRVDFLRGKENCCFADSIRSRKSVLRPRCWTPVFAIRQNAITIPTACLLAALTTHRSRRYVARQIEGFAWDARRGI